MGKINLHNYEAFLIDYLDGNLNEEAIAELKAFVLANPQLDLDLEELDLPSFANEESTIDFKNDLKRTEVFIEDEDVINYLENNLNDADKKSFEIKLLKDKELAVKLSAYSKTILSSESSVFENKASLYKTENELILTNTTLAFVEGQLSFNDKIQFEKELKTNPTLQIELASFQKTKLVADTSIVFEDKEALKKEAKVIALFSFRTVASIAAAILLIITLAFVFNYFNSKPGSQIKEIAKTELNNSSNAKNANEKIVNSVDSNSKVNNSVPLNSNYIAKNVNVKNNINKNEKEIELKESLTYTVINEQMKNIEQEINQESIETKFIASNSKIDTTAGSKLTSNSEQPKCSKQNYLIATEADDDEFVVETTPAKKGFWQRAVQLAKQANKLGVKAIDGEETANKNYSLSFNSFSVERK